MSVLMLSEVLNQPDAVAFLRSTVASGRFGTAYLFHGPSGVGKGTAAFALARAALCTGRAGSGAGAAPGLFDTTEPAPAAPADDACGKCGSCHKVAQLQHPDLKFLFPVSGEEKELETTIAETIEAWRQDPLFVFTYEKAASIRLSITRDLLRELAYKPYESDRRVVVVRDADRMRDDQCSAMLKSIEEPGASTMWILTTSRLLRVPATIRSRCQRVRFAPWSEKAIGEFLAERVGANAAEARMLGALGCGSLGRALVLRDAQPLKTRDQALALLEPALRRDGAGVLRTIQDFNRKWRPGRETLRRVVEFQELWLRDVLRARYGASRDQLVHRDREAEIRRQAERVDPTEIRRRLMALEEALKSIEGNVTADLAMFSALMRVADPAFETQDWPGHVTERWRY